MRLYSVVMALHILTVMGAASVSAVVHASQLALRTSTSDDEARLAIRGYRLLPLFAPLLLVLLGLGLIMMQMTEGQGFRFADGWIWSAIAAVAVMVVDTQVVLVPALRRRADPAALRAAAGRPAAWAVSWANTGLAAGLVLTMVAKPATGLALVVLVAGAALGAAAGLVLRRLTSGRAAAQTSP